MAIAGEREDDTRRLVRTKSNIGPALTEGLRTFDRGGIEQAFSSPVLDPYVDRAALLDVERA